MRADLPHAGLQACPRSLRLLPDRMLLPPATLGVLLRRGALTLEYAGWGLEPAVPDGAPIEARGGRPARLGDLVVASVAGHADLLRLVACAPDGTWRATLDSYPRRGVALDGGSILGVVTAIAGRVPGRWAGLFACRSGVAALHLAARRITAAPAWGADPAASVLEKYGRQVASYAAAKQSNLTEEHLELLSAHAPAEGRILVAGCGAGAEAVHLARLGYRVVGFDAVAGMIEAARAQARDAGRDVRFEIADACRGDWPAGPYDAAYLTPMLYSFLPGSARRMEFLRRLGRSLRPQGAILYSARLHPGARSWLETRLARCRSDSGSDPVAGEPGDWYTRYLAPDGIIRTSFLRRFSAGEVILEGFRAGFGEVERRGSHFVARRFQAP